MDVVKTVHAILHDEKQDFNPDGTPAVNPGMTQLGLHRVSLVCAHAMSVMNLPAETRINVFSGTGERHGEIARIFCATYPEFIQPTANREMFSLVDMLGGPDSLVVIKGEPFVVMSDGRIIPKADYTIPFNAEGIMTFLRSPEVPNFSLLTTGRPFFIQAGLKGESGALYRIELGREHGEINATKLISGVTLADIEHGGDRV